MFGSILEAYRTGRGRIIVRAKTDVEVLDEKTKRMAIIIQEVSIKFHDSYGCLIFLFWNYDIIFPINLS